MNGHTEFDLLDAYALGTLEPQEAARVREHLETCSSCRREYDDVRSVLDVLPHGLPEERPSAALRARLLARLDETAPVRDVMRRPPLLTGVLAAGLALALASDAWLAWQLQQRRRPEVVVVRLTPAPKLQHTPAATARPVPAPTARRTSHAAAPAPSAPPVRVSPDDLALRARIAQLENVLRDEQRSADVRDMRDAARIADLQSALTHETALLAVARRATPRPVAQPSVARTASPELVAALSTGRVFGVDGTVGSEPWHLTIVQPPAGANALIFSQVPHAPAGDTYRTWVLRGGKTFDAGELPAGTQTRLEMPMPLENGDVVAFSREPVGPQGQPTNPFLMELTIKE